MTTSHQPDSTPARSFSDTRVIPCRPGDPRISFGFSEDEVCASQWCDGPTFLVIGHRAPEDAIDRGCLRFGLDPCQVMSALASDRRQECAR